MTANEVNILLNISLVYYAVRCLVGIYLSNEEDIINRMYLKELTLSNKYLGDSIIEIDNRNNMDRFIDAEKKTFTDFNNLLEESSRIESKKNKMKRDSLYRNSVIIKRRLTLAYRYLSRMLKRALGVFLSQLYTLTPVLISVLTASEFMTIATSFIIMIIHSVRKDRIIQMEFIDYGLEGALGEPPVRYSIVLVSALEAVANQGYLILFLLFK